MMSLLLDAFQARSIAIIGNSGSGKSTLASRLSTTRNAPVLDLDSVAWQPGAIAMARDRVAAAADVDRFLERHPRGIVEGCYTGLIDIALRHQSLLLFLDPGVDACIAHCRARPWEPHKYASADEQDARLERLLDWVRGYYRRHGEMSLQAHQPVFDGYVGPKQHITGVASMDAI